MFFRLLRRAATRAGAMYPKQFMPVSKLWLGCLYWLGIQSGISTSCNASIMIKAAPKISLRMAPPILFSIASSNLRVFLSRSSSHSVLMGGR